VGNPGPKGPKGLTGTPYPGQFPNGPVGPTGEGGAGAPGPFGGNADRRSCFEVIKDSILGFDLLLTLKTPAVTPAPTQDTQATCPNGYTAVGGGHNCLPGGWYGSYDFPFGRYPDSVQTHNFDTQGWQGNCGKGPVRIYAMCCPIGTPLSDSFGSGEIWHAGEHSG
jgi:hypothetical protein